MLPAPLLIASLIMTDLRGIRNLKNDDVEIRLLNLHQMNYLGMAIDSYKPNLSYIPTDVPYEWNERARRQLKPTPLQSKRRDETRAAEIQRLLDLQETKKSKKQQNKGTQSSRPKWYEQFEPYAQNKSTETRSEESLPDQRIQAQLCHPRNNNGVKYSSPRRTLPDFAHMFE